MDRIILNPFLLLFALCSRLRYRFFLFAGIFPYLLGQAIAFSFKKSLNWHYFWLGFAGIILVLIGVELFNEYFDAKAGGDRIFLKERPEVPGYFYFLGLLVFILAFFVGLYFVFHVGWPILIFCLAGFLGAYFYVGPPIRWAYRGLGETIIALSYGPFMVLGSFYLQVKRIDILPFMVSVIPGLLIFSLAIVNEIPDYYQDRLVGKKNLVVRLGRKKAIKLLTLILASLFMLLGLGIACKIIPFAAAVSFLLLPWILKSLTRVKQNYDNPQIFLSAIKANIVFYLVIVLSLSMGYLGG